jgi:hypothetical protein
MDLKTRSAVLLTSIAWLTVDHEGLEYYRAIVGREYTSTEKDDIAADTYKVMQLPCPFFDQGKCIFGGLGRHFNTIEEHLSAPYGFLPTMLARLINPAMIKDLVLSGKVADAKVCLLTRNKEFYSREQTLGAR